MISVGGTVRVRASSREVLEFVLDLDRYRQADTKIAKVIVTADLGDGDDGRVRYRGRLFGLPTPAVWNSVHLDRWRHLEFCSQPSGLADLFLASFVGTFDCETVEDGSVVRHEESFTFRRPWDRAIEPALRRWLERQMVDEMDRLRALIDESVA